MSDDKLLDERMQGAKALELLSNDLLKDAFAVLRKTYSDKLFSTSVDQQAAREKLYMAFRLVSEFESHLQSIVNDGKLADAQLNALIAAAEAKKKWQDVR